ncbi:putative leucine-rich repeat receptor-like serine/threonine-protein kinase [Platanthera zijinensis]|uniref:Leucine-rich repeat receptor-like serine/threonine-protein kinase n=1 Tax=Platanthera zijinensis TaxID=2320716 RepID=A0AAP0FZH3_9ASPA
MGTTFSCFGRKKSSTTNSKLCESILSKYADAHPSHQSTYTFSYNEMRSATSSFHPTNKIGYGGFGTVYKGILSDGTQVAIKSLSIESKQGIREFLTEIEMLSNVRHPNLVRLIGCCVEGANRMLVYEYMENNSLARALLGPYNKQIALNWTERAAICLGAANGLAFLHEEVEPNIVHRDIKASNVLLDKNLRPKIGDFGLAKLFPDTVTHVSTRVAGTMGYLAPEYALLGKLTKKADIYSFGVLMLEIISGRSCARSVWGLDMKALLEWTWQLRGEDRLLDIVDPELAVYPKNEALHFIKTALFCTQAAAHQRPNMKRVVEMLQSSDEAELFVGALKQPGVLRAPDRSFGIVGNKPVGSKYPRYSESKTTYGFISTAEDSSSAPVSTFEMQPR